MKMQTSIRVDEKFYKETKEVFSQMGLSFADGINIFLAKVSHDKKIPFELSIEPSEELEKRVENIKSKKNTSTYDSSDELFEDLGI